MKGLLGKIYLSNKTESMGICKVRDEVYNETKKAVIPVHLLKEAVELLENMNVEYVEVAVLGNDSPVALTPIDLDDIRWNVSIVVTPIVPKEGDKDDDND